MLRDDCAAIRDQARDRVAVAKKPSNFFSSASGLRPDRAPFATNDFASVRNSPCADRKDRFAGQNRFDGILPTPRGKTLPHENDGSDAIPVLQLTSRIEKETIAAASRCFAAQRDLQTKLLKS